MSSRTLLVTTCDICADEGVETAEAVHVEFPAFGQAVNLDLCDTHRDEVRERLLPYLELSTRLHPPMRYTRSRPTARPDLKAVRAWAKAQGLAVNDRGRISIEVQKKYDAAH